MAKSNTNKTAPWLTQLGAWVTLALLTGCNTNGGQPPADAPSALVYGAASSPVLDDLRAKVRLTDAGSVAEQGVGLVVFDGDAFSAEQIAKDPFIAKAIQSGNWVLGLDLSEDDKRGLRRIIGASTPSPSGAYLLRQSQRPDGSLLYTMVEPGAVAQTPGGAAQEILSRLNRLPPSAKDVPAPVSQGLHTVTYQLEQNYDPDLGKNLNPLFNRGVSYRNCRFNDLGAPTPIYPCSFPVNPGSQQSSWNVVHQVQVFFDIGLSSSAFQHLLVTTVGSATPNGPIFNNQNNCSYAWGNCEVAWFQTRFDDQSSFPVSSGLLRQESSPANLSNANSVTSGLSFDVNFLDDVNNLRRYTYSDSSTYPLNDWEVVNRSKNTNAEWAFASRLHYRGLQDGGYDDSMWFYYYAGVAPQNPSELSMSKFLYKTQTHWANQQYSTDVVTLSGTDRAFYDDAWVMDARADDQPNDNNRYCIDSCSLVQHYKRTQISRPWSLDIDLSKVVPVQ